MKLVLDPRERKTSRLIDFYVNPLHKVFDKKKTEIEVIYATPSVFVDDSTFAVKAIRSEDFYSKIEPGLQLEDDYFIDWALEKGMKVVVDYSWETLHPNHNCEISEEDIQFIDDNNIKILLNHSNQWYHLYNNDTDPRLMKAFVDIDIFPHNTRYLHEFANHDWNSQLYPTSDKKYLYTTLLSDMRKPENLISLVTLTMQGVIDKGYVSRLTKKVEKEFVLEDTYNRGLGILHDHEQRGDSLSLTEEHEYLIKHWDELMVHNSYDNPDVMHMEIERRLPQQMYESYFCLQAETLDHPFFFTEKSYKAILQDTPYIFFNWKYNHVFKEKYGYEIFDEIFDFSYESDNYMKGNWIYNLRSICKQINNLNVDVFYQESVKDKVRHNKEIFMQSTTPDKALENFYRAFSEC